MPINNLNNVHLTSVQMQAFDDALTTMETALEALKTVLNPKERSVYGSVNEQNKLFINKDRDFRQNSPQLSDSEIDWTEFEKDYQSRLFLESAFNRMEGLLERIRDAKILHDYDNYQTALDDYGFTTYRAGSGSAGFQTKMEELKQFFVRRDKGVPAEGEGPK